MSQDFPLGQEMETEDGDTNDPDHHRAEAIVLYTSFVCTIFDKLLTLKKNSTKTMRNENWIFQGSISAYLPPQELPIFCLHSTSLYHFQPG